MKLYETIGTWDYVLVKENPRPVALPGLRQCRVVYSNPDPKKWPADRSPTDAFLRNQVAGLVRPGANIELLMWDVEKGPLGNLCPNVVGDGDTLTALADEHVRLIDIAVAEMARLGQTPLVSYYCHWMWDHPEFIQPWLRNPGVRRLLGHPRVVLQPAWYSRTADPAKWRSVITSMYKTLRRQLPAAKIIPALRPYYYHVPGLEGQWIPAEFMRAQLDTVAATSRKALIFTEELSWPVISQRMLPWFVEVLRRCL